ncbi:alpha/beta hydrolase-fold protein [Ferruginibacter paludis]|uniref:alpha/beta hydrolase n=1 Tax=Ferruginibacter paludis TaxID=1310417 RepID=UPI0025B42748|nr:alpha/beta hydrolase-fold protein [Ferruginibacter paludis]MDN3655488.1 alpha/beta hydrolase-fold protein [Ferruginibacter paludis]
MPNNHKRLYLFLCACLCAVTVTVAQYTVTLHIVQQPALHAGDSIFAAGNFNNWQPADGRFYFVKQHGYLSLQIKNVPATVVEFKCTRGDWGKTESALAGADIGNHVISITGDTTIEISIAAWKDDFTPVVKQHTVSPNVHILDTAFAVPQLNSKRRIWIYLPPGYHTGNEKYPVMYLQDGQNLFDAYTAAFGEWGVDEILDSMVKKGAPPCIVVGIDNGVERMQEYNPFDNEKFGKGKGEVYVDFLVQTLKPFIDGHYRTLRSKNRTIIGGSSMGGLISFYALLKYPDVFGRGGIFSPAFWTADGIKKLTDSAGNKLTGKLFFYIGELEGGTYVNDMEEVVETVAKKSDAMIYKVIDPEGQHNEQAWHKWFADFYRWIMSDGFNNAIRLDK